MIFISHNEKDKVVVESFANDLADVFGMENVFYDSWSIQPGDGIIDRMEEGLSNTTFFFFFVSKNSLKSNMVKLEWQNAIMKATKGEIKFIPIRLDDSAMPHLLTQTLYLDVYKNGAEVVLRQMIDVVNGKNTYVRADNTYENIKARVKRISDREIDVEFYAETYMEPISRYGIIVSNEEADVDWRCTSDATFLSGFNKDGANAFGVLKFNVLAVTVQRATTPGFPVIVKVQSKSQLNFIGVLRAKNSDVYESISWELA